MIRFECDYSEGAHPRIMQALSETNLVQTPGYSEDEYCARARELIRRLCRAPEADVQFLVGGTLANLSIISSILRPYQGVLTAELGHITIHETGSIEATGHKVLPLPSPDGKISAAQVRRAHAEHWADPDHEHIVQPGMVYISHPTERGTTYSLAELTELSAACRELGLPLFMDGARLGCALGEPGTDVTLPDIARLCDVFYIGGTKLGLLFGEAVVICDRALQKDFRYSMKQRGGMLAKGRLLGVQFLAALEDGLYFDLGKKAVAQALRIRAAMEKTGVPAAFDSRTNQQFFIIKKADYDTLSEKYAFCPWSPVGDDSILIRICTSWATKDEDVAALIADIEKTL